jgi:hypothetical protein
MNPTCYYRISICPKDLTWSPNARRAAMPACLHHETDRQGCGLIASLPTHATENRP